MFSNQRVRIVIALCLVLLAVLAFGSAVLAAQEDGDNQPAQPAEQAQPAAPAAEAPQVDTGGLDPSEAAAAGMEGLAPDVINAIPIQGRLTDSGGTVINSSRVITMTLYTASSGGTVVCTDPDTVNPVNGLFSAYMDFCTPADINGQQLYLGIWVRGEPSEMTPRQPIYVTPYAYSLVDGANIASLKSSANTVITISPFNAVQSGASGLTFQYFSLGYLQGSATGAGTHWIYIPVNLPSIQYGTANSLAAVRVCYDMDNAADFIAETNVRQVTDAGGSQDLIIDTANRNSTSWSCYTITDPTPAQIAGSMFIRFEVTIGAAGRSIRIGNLSLTLTQP